MRSLVYVDDEPDLLELGKYFLELGGEFTVDAIRSADDALAHIDRRACDAIISDYQMPGMDGIEFLKQVRASGNHVPFIIFTGRGREEVVIEALNEGADFYIQKGGNPEPQFAELAHKIRTAIYQRTVDTELRKGEEQHRSIIQTAMDGFLLLDSEGRILEVNDAYCTMTGYRPQELIGTSIHEREETKCPGETADHIEQIKIRGEDRFGTRHRRKDGTLFHAHASVQYKPIDGGRFIVFLHTNDHTSAIDALEEERERLHGIIEGTRAGTWEWNVQTGGLTINERWAEILGYTPGELSPVGFHTWESLVHPDDLPACQRTLERHFSGELPNFECEYRLKHKDGHWVWLIGRGRLMTRTPQGKPLMMFGTHTDISPRKRAEEALRDSEANFRTFFETIGDLIVVGTPDGRILYTNAAVTRKLGYTREELEGMHVLDLHPVACRAEAEQIFSAMFRGERDTCPLPLGSKSGALLPVETRAWFGRWNGEDCIFGVSKDLAAEQEATQRFERLFRHNPALMALSSVRQNAFVDVNDMFLATLGYSREDIVGKGSHEINLFPSADHQRQIRDQLRLSGRISNVELQVRCKDGALLDGVFSGEIITSQGEEYFLTVMINVTERKQLEQELRVHEKEILRFSTELAQDHAERSRVEGELRETEEKFREIFDNANDAIQINEIRCDGFPGKFSDVNEVACRMLGFSREEMLCMGPLDISMDFHDRPVKDILGELVTKGESFFETEHRRKDGGIVPVEVNSHLITRGDKKIVISVVRDITERKRSEVALRKANRQLKLLASITRHDINNKITVILGYLSMAERKSRDPAIAEYFKKIQDATEAVHSQIEFTKVYQNLGTHEPQWQELERLVSRTHLPAHVTLDMEMPGVMVFADPMLEKVFVNLLDNSLRHGGQVSKIRVFCHESGKGMHITWEDNGAGVPPELKEKIFERGFGKNTGLGMFLSREILHLTGLTIHENGVPGKGARFDILVPKGMYRVKGSDKNP